MTTRDAHDRLEFASWHERNRAHLDLHVRRVRLLVERRCAWLRSRWRIDPLKQHGTTVISDQAADLLLQGEDRAARLAFYEDDPDARELGRLHTEVERKLSALENECERNGALPALGALARLFGLNDIECDVVALCLAPEIDPGLDALYAYVQDDASRRYPTLHLACNLFELDAAHARACLAPHAPLTRLRLITLDSAGAGASSSAAMSATASRALRLTERATSYLLGDNHLDARVAEWLRALPLAPLSARHRALIERLASHVAAHAEARVINLTGPKRCGKRAVAQSLSDRLGLTACELDLLRLAAVEREEALRLLEREAALARLAYYIAADEADRADRALAALQADLVSRCGAFVLIGSAEPYSDENNAAFGSENAPFLAAIEKPDAAEQRELWRASVPHTVADGEIDKLIQQFDLGPTEVARATREASAQARMASGGDAPLCADPLWRACRSHAARGLEALGLRIRPCYEWDDLVLPSETKQQLREIAAQVAHRSQVYETWGFGAKLVRGRGISALFAGPSGVGKTMAAEVLAHHLDLDLFRIDLAGVVSKYIGETEKNLKRVFDAAEASGAILFFDEADALFGKRTEVKDSHDRYANIEIDYLLQRMEDYRGLAILATNMKAHLDAAFLRRLRFIVDLPFPDAAIRRGIWARVFPASAPTEDLDYAALARLEVAGGNIRNIALAAAFLAASAGEPIRMQHVLAAARREYDKIEKLPSAAEFGAYQ